METGYDILFFWVARMIMMGIHFMGEVPFRRVLLAGLVTDERGQKMSKVKGNVIDPLDVIGGASLEDLLEKARQAGATKAGEKYIEKTYPEGFAAYGADALRMTLLSYSPQSKRIALSLKRVEGYRNFSNKLWNAARFVLSHVDAGEPLPPLEGRAPRAKLITNRWLLSRLHPRSRARTKESRTIESTTHRPPSIILSGTSSAIGPSNSANRCLGAKRRTHVRRLFRR